MGLSAWQLLLVAVVFMLLFGRGKIPALMSDLASGIKSFKAGIKEDSDSSGPSLSAQDSNHLQESAANKTGDQV